MTAVAGPLLPLCYWARGLHCLDAKDVLVLILCIRKAAHRSHCKLSITHLMTRVQRSNISVCDTHTLHYEPFSSHQ